MKKTMMLAVGVLALTGATACDMNRQRGATTTNGEVSASTAREGMGTAFTYEVARVDVGQQQVVLTPVRGTGMDTGTGTGEGQTGQQQRELQAGRDLTLTFDQFRRFVQQGGGEQPGDMIDAMQEGAQVRVYGVGNRMPMSPNDIQRIEMGDESEEGRPQPGTDPMQRQ